MNSLCGTTGGEFVGSYYMPCFISYHLASGFHIMVSGFHNMVFGFHITFHAHWKYRNAILNVTFSMISFCPQYHSINSTAKIKLVLL